MTRKLKLSLAGLGFLGVNGVAWPSLESSLRSLGSALHTNWGGGN